MRVDDNNIVEQLKKRNPKALDYLIERYSNLVFKVSFSILGSRETAEECINDVFYKVWNSIEGFNKDKSKFVTWLVVITKYTAIDYTRKEKKHKDNVSLDSLEHSGDLNLEEVIVSRDQREKLLNEIKIMDKENREIFIRRFFLEESIKEISKSLGLSETAVSNRILRGRKKLANLLKEEVS